MLYLKLHKSNQLSKVEESGDIMINYPKSNSQDKKENLSF